MIIFGLGSNLGDTKKNFQDAIQLLEERLIKNVTRSKIYKFPPLLPADAPADWNKEFSNMVITAELKRTLEPQRALQMIKGMEMELGRKPARRWAPRIIDIDILAWNNYVCDSQNLTIPHPGLSQREFVLKPLLELLPDWIDPKTGTKASEYLKDI